MYKIHINDMNYTSWTIYKMNQLSLSNDHEVDNNTNICNLPINIIDHKLFTNDLFTVDETYNMISIIESPIRSNTMIPVVLVLNNNKTFGRKNGKLLYKCIPNDTSLPAFLIPYEIKNIGFSKIFSNLYITFQFKEWTDKHPLGQITQTIGSVDKLENFYEYILYCKDLHISITNFTKDTQCILQSRSHEELIKDIRIKYPSIEDRTNNTIWPVFTIDPLCSLDFDDGFSIKMLDNNICMLSIYISNVTVWIDYLKLWKSFSQRVSTIYMPNNKRPMLPPILSDKICSLKSNQSSIAFVLDTYIDMNTNNIIDMKYSVSIINVYKNYCYEEDALLTDTNYLKLMEVGKKLSHKYKYISSIKDSHDIVCYMMIHMNYITAKELLEYNNGIFRSNVINKDIVIPSNVPDDVGKFIKILNSNGSMYIDISTNETNQSISHDSLDMDAYIHITSPIRRLVDLLNIIQFQQNKSLIQLSDDSWEFHNKWLKNIEYINKTMKSIQRVQNECNLLHMCMTNQDIMEKVYDGYIIDCINTVNTMYRYNVFLPELKLTSHIITNIDMKIYEKHQFKLYLFNNMDKFKKKIRLGIID